MPERTADQTALLRYWYESRQRARTDLLHLCNEVLQYKDVCQEVHGPIIEQLQQFRGGTDKVNPKTGDWASYEPFCSCWELEGPRKRLFLDPRGHLKTTVITIAHTIQWVINYPDIRVLISMATGNQVQAVMSETLNHFRFNEKFRWLFPEFCPLAERAKDFGNMESFTVPNRVRKWLKEPTVACCTVGRVIAGAHQEVHKNSDLVDKENVKTPNQINDVISHFKFLNPLLERGGSPPRPGWIDVEGTRYDAADLYGWIKEQNERNGEWQISERKAIDESGKILWAKRYSLADLNSIKADDEYVFSSQYLQNPIPAGSALATRDELRFVPRKILKSVPMHQHMTVDLAGMDPNSSGDFTVFNVHGFDRDGRMNVLEVLAGRYAPSEVIEILFTLYQAFPQLLDVKIEKDAHARVLLPFLRREQEKRKKYLPPIIELKRDNRTSKKQRIKGLQPWFRSGLIRFAEEITARLETIHQILTFSDTSTTHDDVLDTLADGMQNREGGVTYDVLPDEEKTAAAGRGGEKFDGFDPLSRLERWAGDSEYGGYIDPAIGF